MKAHVKPCVSCPYRKDCPSGVWHESEYEKLRAYDDNMTLDMFLCHTESEKLCRGWLSVHSESVAVRLLMMRGKVASAEVYADPPVPLFGSGNKAADHGQKQIKRPTHHARKMIARLIKSRKYILK